jgi:hypothetical protein
MKPPVERCIYSIIFGDEPGAGENGDGACLYALRRWKANGTATSGYDAGS